jgi:hypothetical protein
MPLIATAATAIQIKSRFKFFISVPCRSGG